MSIYTCIYRNIHIYLNLERPAGCVDPDFDFSSVDQECKRSLSVISKNSDLFGLMSILRTTLVSIVE